MANREATCMQNFLDEISISISRAVNGTCVKTLEKVPKYHNQEYVKYFFFWSLDLQWWFKYWKKSYFGSKKDSSTNKLSMTKVESFLKPIFDLNQIPGIVFTKTINLGNYTQPSWNTLLLKIRFRLLPKNLYWKWKSQR